MNNKTNTKELKAALRSKFTELMRAGRYEVEYYDPKELFEKEGFDLDLDLDNDDIHDIMLDGADSVRFYNDFTVITKQYVFTDVESLDSGGEPDNYIMTASYTMGDTYVKIQIIPEYY